MKELSIEEKAKAYDGLIERLKDLKFACRFSPLSDTIDEIFPELAESVDECIRKSIIHLVKKSNEQGGYALHKDEADKMIAWLEKQGEKEKFIKKELDCIRGYRKEAIRRLQELEKQGESTEINPSEFDLQLNRLLKQFKSLPKEDLASSLSFYLNVVQNDGTYKEEKQGEQKHQYNSRPKYIGEEELLGEQKPAEWSEEDEQLYNDLSDTYFYNDEDYPEETYKLMLKRVLDWMNKRAKFLRPQSTWKPSEGQMELLREVQQALLGKDCHNRFVDFMYELKRLREE